ncbi:MAG: NAD-dependent epimerase/dehydratase family protein [Deltaproteobacteria bacterium]|nr:MAG: NAD-dependent epimerase/dehydratase family protein [Deltaproteobacteria bacterium]
MNALVTGANGFIGSNLSSRLLEKGHSVRALILPGTDESTLNDMDVQKVYGDITDPSTLPQALKGINVVFHLAAIASDWGPRKLFLKVNAEGSRNMAEISLEYGVSRFVQMSSLAIHSFRGISDGDENTPRDCFKFHYSLSKIKAEDYVLALYRDKGLPITIIRPGVFPFGPNDMTSFYHLAQAMEKDQYGYINGGRAALCVSYVENLADGMILAATHPKGVGETYVISDDIKTTWRELSEKFCDELGCPYPRLNVPFPLIYPFVALWDGVYQTLGTKNPPTLTRYRVSLVARDFYFSNRKAKEELGYQVGVSLEEGIRRTVAWYLKAKKERGHS